MRRFAPGPSSLAVILPFPGQAELARHARRPIVLAFLVLLVWLAKSTSAWTQEFPIELVPGTSPDPSSVDVEITAPLVGSDTDTSSLTGSGSLLVTSPTAPFGLGQITELVVQLEDGMSFELSALGITVTAVAAPQATRVRMLDAGPAGDVIGDRFTQRDNVFEFEGEVLLSTEAEPFDLSQVAPIVADLEDILLARDGSLLTANINIDLLFETAIASALGQVPLTIDIHGQILATANVGVAGDIDGDGVLGAGDIDLLFEALRTGSTSDEFDLNGDGLNDPSDVAFLVEELIGTYFGDANLDGEFNSGDLVSIFQLGEYEDSIPENSTWSTGDWNGDGDFDTSDFVTAFQGGGFEQGPRPAVAAATSALVVPEPQLGIWLLAILGLCPRKSGRLKH